MKLISSTFYHASAHEFSMPNYNRIHENTTNHENGLLGLWVSVKSDWITTFGGNIYQMDVSGTCQDITVPELRAYGNDPETFIQIRQKLLADGCDVLRLVEQDGHSDMSIVINFSAIKNFFKKPDLASSNLMKLSVKAKF